MGIDSRQHRRLRLTGTPPPARLFNASDRTEVSFRHVDVSKRGLGLLIAERFVVGADLTMVVDAYEVALQVRWCAPEADSDNLYRYGLLALTEEIDLEQIFFSYGCLEEDLDLDTFDS